MVSMRVSKIILLAALLCVAAKDALAALAKSRTYVVTIGVDEYQDSFWPSLRWSIKDANKFAQELRADGRDVVAVSLLGKNATLANVRKALRAISREAGAQDVLVVYLTGHGTLDETTGGLGQYFVTYDTDSKNIDKTALGHDELRKLVDGNLARRKLVVLATCHSGLGKSKLSPHVQQLLAGSKGAPPLLEDVSEGALILAAAARGETAREDDRLSGDVYTYFFLEGLRTNDRNQDGAVSALEAHDYARDRTYTYSKGAQRPTAEAKFIGDADVVLRGRKKSAGAPVLQAYEDSMKGFSVRANGRTKGSLPTAIALEPGTNEVEILPPDKGGTVQRYRVNVSSGETIQLADLLAPQPWYAVAGFVTGFWYDPVVQKLSGSDAQRNHGELRIGRRTRYIDIDLGVRGPLSKELGEGTPRPALRSTFAYQGNDLRLGKSMQVLPKLHLGGFLGLNYGAVTLGFEDAKSGAELGKRVASYGPLFGVGAAWEFGRGIDMRLNFIRIVGDFDFGDLGKISGTRNEVFFGFGYNFGGVARSL